jgi:hypothetical protein
VIVLWTNETSTGHDLVTCLAARSGLAQWAKPTFIYDMLIAGAE